MDMTAWKTGKVWAAAFAASDAWRLTPFFTLGFFPPCGTPNQNLRLGVSCRGHPPRRCSAEEDFDKAQYALHTLA